MPRKSSRRIIYNHERAISTTVNDIEHVESTSYNGVGIIKVFLQPGTSVDAGVAQITAVAQTVLKQMPPGQTPPLVIRYNASTVPILQYSISSPKMSEEELYDVTQNQVRVGLATVPGTAIPWPYGGKTRLVSVDLDLPALRSKSLSPQDVVNAISSQNLILPSGTAKIGTTEYDIELNASTRVAGRTERHARQDRQWGDDLCSRRGPCSGRISARSKMWCIKTACAARC